MNKLTTKEKIQRKRYFSSLFRKSVNGVLRKDLNVIFKEVYTHAASGVGEIQLIFDYNHLVWKIISKMEALENLKLGTPKFDIIRYNNINEHEVVGKTYVNSKDRRFLAASKNNKKVTSRIHAITGNILTSLYGELYLAFLIQELKITKISKYTID